MSRAALRTMRWLRQAKCPHCRTCIVGSREYCVECGAVMAGCPSRGTRWHRSGPREWRVEIVK